MKKKIIYAETRPKGINEKKASIDIILSAIEKDINTENDLLRLKKRACSKYKVEMISNTKLIYVYNNLVKDKKIDRSRSFYNLIRKRKIRTISGIASLAVLTKPYDCPGKCLFCPSQKDVPKSYIDNEPAVMRAILVNYDPVRQVNVRIEGFEVVGNPAEKIELIVMGGTFSYLPTRYQYEFILGCFEAANNYSRNKLKDINSLRLKDFNLSELKQKLHEAQIKNETSDYKIVGLTLETRPDYISKKELVKFRDLGCTRVEIGVQSIYDDVLNVNNRGHDVKEIVDATRLLKNFGFKINYHMMPNLYGSNLSRDKKMFKKLFTDSRFQPDMLKIYPCVVTKYSEYIELFNDNKFIPYTDDELIELILDIKKDLPEYVRIQRLIRDIPKQNIIAGSTVSNLRQIIGQHKNFLCNCIRCREIKTGKKKKVFLKRTDYDASEGIEVFLQYIDEDNRIYSLLRLRIPKQNNDLIAVLNNSSLVREVHTFGPLVGTFEKNSKNTQHTGLGRKLISEAERISKEEFKLNKIAIISGVGVRGYYKKLGYELTESYMVKNL